MIKSLKDIKPDLKIQICNCYEKRHDFDYLKEKFNYLENNILLSILYSTGKYDKEVNKLLCKTSISNKKILINSDSHYCSIYENMNYTYGMFDFAAANGFNVILNGGDIIEGDVKPRNDLNVIQQAEYFINEYPFDENIKTYALLGNHDYRAINKHPFVKGILSSRDDINILDLKKSFINWDGNIISLQHTIDSYKLRLPYTIECLCFKGHSHYYHIRKKTCGKSERIFIPAMCDDPVINLSNTELDKNATRPGFLTAEIFDDNIVVVHYSFINNKIEKKNEFKKVLVKK